MSRNSLLDFYREIVNSEKSFDIDYKNLSKQLIERINKAIEYIKEMQNSDLIFTHICEKELLEILGGEDNVM